MGESIGEVGCWTRVERNLLNTLLVRRRTLFCGQRSQQERQFVVSVLEPVEQVNAATMLCQQREFEGAEVLPLVNHSDGAHQRAQDELHVILEIVDLPSRKKTRN